MNEWVDELMNENTDGHQLNTGVHKRCGGKSL